MTLQQYYLQCNVQSFVSHSIQTDEYLTLLRSLDCQTLMNIRKSCIYISIFRANCSLFGGGAHFF